MRRFLDQYERIKLTILVLIVASLPYYIMISSVLIALGILVTLVKVIAVRRIEISKLTGPSIALLCYFALELIGLTYTEKENLSLGLFSLERHQGFVLLPFFFLDLEVSAAMKKKILRVFSISCIAGTVVCLVANVYFSITEYNTFIHEWRFSHGRLAEPIDIHPAYFAMYLGVVIAFLLVDLRDNFATLSLARKTWMFLGAVYLTIFIVFLGARTLTAAMMLIIVAGLIYDAFARKSYKMLGLAALVPVVFVSLVFSNPIVRTRFVDLLGGQSENSNYGGFFARSNIWSAGIDLIKDNFWLGVGTGDYESELNRKLIENNLEVEADINMNMHNQYLQTALDIGVLGFLIFLATLLMQLKVAWTHRDLIYLTFLALFMFGCITESMLNSNKGIIFFAIFSCMFYSTKEESAPQPDK